MKKMHYVLLVGACFIGISFFLILPLIDVIQPSFIDGGFTLKYYFEFLGDPFYQRIILRTIKISLITTLWCILLGVPTAYFLTQQKPKVKVIMNAIIMFPLLTNAVVRSFAWMNILGTRGTINTILLNFRIIDEPLSMLYSEFAIIIGSIYLFLPIMITTLTPIMEGIEEDVILATQSLGAKPLGIFMKMIIPLSFSGILIGSVLVFTGVMSAYTTPSLLGGNKNMMLATLLYQQANQLSNWTQSGLISLLMVVISVLLMSGLSYINRRLDKRGASHA